MAIILKPFDNRFYITEMATSKLTFGGRRMMLCTLKFREGTSLEINTYVWI